MAADFINSPLMRFLRGDGTSAVYSGTGNTRYTAPALVQLPVKKQVQQPTQVPTVMVDKTLPPVAPVKEVGKTDKPNKPTSSFDKDMAYITKLGKQYTPQQMIKEGYVNENNAAFKKYLSKQPGLASTAAVGPLADNPMVPVKENPIGVFKDRKDAIALLAKNEGEVYRNMYGSGSPMEMGEYEEPTQVLSQHQLRRRGEKIDGAYAPANPFSPRV